MTRKLNMLMVATYYGQPVYMTAGSVDGLRRQGVDLKVLAPPPRQPVAPNPPRAIDSSSSVYDDWDWME